MPIDPGTTQPLFLSQLAANGLVGPGTPAFATGLATGFYQYLTTSIGVHSIDVGTLGVGTGIGVGLLLPESAILEVLEPMLSGFGILGQKTPDMANAIAAGISISLGAAIVQTANPTVGIGSGKVQLIPEGTGATTFVEAFSAAGMLGSKSESLASAVGTSLDALIALTLGVIVIVGTPSIVPSTGFGTGVIQ